MPASGNLDIFLKLNGIDGESTVKGHEKEIAVLSYEQAVDVAVVVSGSGGGASAGKTTFPGVKFRKNVDVASVPLLLACASGQHISDARFTFRLNGILDFYSVTLQDVLIVDVVQRAGTGAQYPLSFEALNTGASSDGFLDQVVLNFSRILWEHRAQNPNGSVGVTATGGWDVRANRKI
jgi:type VI secretion system secreted protein Hcp